MKKCLFKVVLLLLILCISLSVAVSAEVFTTQKTEGMADCVYVAGEHDSYPIEYYDSKKEKYCGIIPDLLEKISDQTDIDFVYINGDKTDKNSLGKNLQIDIVSAAEKDKSLSYYDEYVELFSYKKDGKIQKTGLIFTSIADDEIITKIEAAINDVSADEKNGIFLAYSVKEYKTDYKWIILAILLCSLFAVALAILILRINNIKKECYNEKMTDSETGLGNLQYFKYHFKNTINDTERNLYYIAYIILDSSYLRSYHGESSFDDVLKYTSLVLSENAGDREFAARITENGFAFAIQSSNDEDALNRLEEIMCKLNLFEDMKEKNNKIVFHSAIYHLSNRDKNCEILLFNLRKNCNKIFGTDKQTIFCDIHSMNKIQEEKKITESILNGFEHNEFKMYLQFIVDNKTKQIVSAEALSRWDSPSKGLIGPGKYIENMEIAGLISKHDFYMFELACRQLEKWNCTEFKNISLSCNFTRITLSEENFIERLKMISNSYSFDKSKLSIEITEDAIEKNREIATKNVMFCKELGFRVYLDDLGSGYTSLANLCDYPIDIVKIDRDILLKTETERGKALFAGIIALAHSLNIKVICEGVETEYHNTLVGKSDCDFIQGWYYSKALPLEECESFIARYESKTDKK